MGDNITECRVGWRTRNVVSSQRNQRKSDRVETVPGGTNFRRDGEDNKGRGAGVYVSMNRFLFSIAERTDLLNISDLDSECEVKYYDAKCLMCW